MMRATTRRLTAVALALALTACAHLDHQDGDHDDSRSPDVPDHVHHTIDYIELTVTDMAAARAFYAAAFGWTFNDYGPDYSGIVRGDGEAGGMALGDGVTTGAGAPLVILYSADLEASVEAVRAAGGEIVVDVFAFPGGRRFHFADPSGNVLAGWGE